MTLSEFSLSNSGELMLLYGSSANNVILWGPRRHELGDYTSIVRITVTSHEWLVSHIRLIHPTSTCRFLQYHYFPIPNYQ